MVDEYTITEHIVYSWKRNRANSFTGKPAGPTRPTGFGCRIRRSLARHHV